MKVPANNPFKRLLRSYDLNQEEFAIIIGKQRRTAQRICNAYKDKLSIRYLEALGKFIGRSPQIILTELQAFEMDAMGIRKTRKRKQNQ